MCVRGGTRFVDTQSAKEKKDCIRVHAVYLNIYEDHGRLNELLFINIS